MKRIISMFLVFVMLFSALPLYALAAGEEQAEVDTGDIIVQSTNGFGTLLSTEIMQEQALMEEEEAEYPAGYSVTDLVIDGKEATVTYDTLEEAILIVALYTEDGQKMLMSVKETVSADRTDATVTFTDDLPEYFLASAYLLDVYDYSPLCAAYDTPMYTREMQELLASTVDDYDSDRILNLDDDDTTNFAVYAETTKVIEYVDGFNKVASADDHTKTYVIENVDQQITGLKAGDVFAYVYNENDMLIVKIDSISVKGTTATIVGKDVEMEEVFSRLKVSSEGNTGDVIVDDSTADDFITYDGLIQDGVQTFAFEGDTNLEMKHKFEIDWYSHTSGEGVGEESSSSVKVTGSLNFTLKTGLNYYISMSHQYLKFKTDFTIGLNIGVTGKAEVPVARLGSFGWMPVAGLYVGFEPKLEFHFSGTVEWAASVKMTAGFAFDSKKGAHSLFTNPKVESDLKVEGSIFFGIDLNPKVKIVGGAVAEVSMTALLGLKLEAELGGKMVDYSPAADKVHTCLECIEGKVNFVVESSIELQLLKAKFLTVTANILDWELELFEFFYRLDDGTFAFGPCPNYTYRVTATVKDQDGKPVEDVEVAVVDGLSWGMTNKYGTLAGYLPKGIHILYTKIGDEIVREPVEVTEACAVTLTNGEEDGIPGILGMVSEEEITDTGSVIASGECGADGDNLTWTLTSGGLLTISGSGEMASFSSIYRLPWYKHMGDIKRIVMKEGITTISSNAFNCDSTMSSLTSVTIPNTVTTIGDYAFMSCPYLTGVQIPASVTAIGDDAFHNCRSLTGIWVDENNKYFINDSCGVLYNKNKTELIQAPGSISGAYMIPEGVVTVDDCAFAYCYALTSVFIPGTVRTIEGAAFKGNSNMTNVIISNGVVTIGNEVFYNCRSLESVKIPNSVTAIGSNLFYNCKYLTAVTISNKVTRIENSTFANCERLSDLTIPKSVTFIGSSVFSNCYSLADIYYSGTESQWNSIDNSSYNSYLKNATIHYNSSVMAASEPVAMDSGDVSDSFDIPTLDAIYGGEYGTEGSVKTASFKGLVAGSEYALLAMKSIEGEDPLTADNLLYVDQAVALEDGTLSFRYIQRETTEVSYVMACGPSDRNLADAEIVFPGMAADEELQAVNPVVIYDGVTLKEGRDYILLGIVGYTECGVYTCYIRGIRNYSGLVECKYTVSDVTRLSGKGRCETAYLAADELKAVLGIEEFEAIIIASGDNFADALAGSYLAAVKEAPILLYRNGYADDNAKYIAENMADDGTVYILGGTAAVPQAMEDVLSGYDVRRVKGANRFETNLKILEEAGVGQKDILVATGYNFADSLSASATGMPILLVYNGSTQLTASQETFLEGLDGNHLVVIGGTGAVNDDLYSALKAYGQVERVKGSGREATSVAVAKKYFDEPDAVVLAYSRNFPDGLCGGPLAYAMGAPLLLTNSGNEAVTAAYAAENGLASGFVLGGTAAVSDKTVRTIFAMGPDAAIPAKK